MAGFEHHPKTWFAGEAASRAVYSLQRYFRDFTGAWFDRLADAGQPDRITANDIVAVSMLSVTVPPRAMIWILDDGADAIHALLREIPTDADFWEAGALIADGSPLSRLWSLLQQRDAQWEGGSDANGIGPVIAGKLLSAKRPRLVPVFDHVVAEALGATEPHTYWRSWHDAFADGELLPAVRAVQDEAAQGHPEIAQLSALRVLDVVIWHQNR